MNQRDMMLPDNSVVWAVNSATFFQQNTGTCSRVVVSLRVDIVWTHENWRCVAAVRARGRRDIYMIMSPALGIPHSPPLTLRSLAWQPGFNCDGGILGQHPDTAQTWQHWHGFFSWLNTPSIICYYPRSVFWYKIFPSKVEIKYSPWQMTEISFASAWGW